MKNIKNKWVGILGISAGAFCCSLPGVSALFGVTVLVAMGPRFEKAAIIFLGIGATASIIPFLMKRRRRINIPKGCARNGTNSWATDCLCKHAGSTKEIVN